LAFVRSAAPTCLKSVACFNSVSRCSAVSIIFHFDNQLQLSRTEAVRVPSVTGAWLSKKWHTAKSKSRERLPNEILILATSPWMRRELFQVGLFRFEDHEFNKRLPRFRLHGFLPLSAIPNILQTYGNR
jgi:hypothetical protein